MKAVVYVILLCSVPIFWEELTSYTQLTDSISWVQWMEKTSTSKVWVPSSGSSLKYCWDKIDSSYNWGGGTGGVCSNSSYNTFPYNSQYLLCPTDNSCNSQYYYLYSDYSVSVTSQYVPQGGVWYYVLQKNSNQYDGIKIIPTINQNVTMTIYSSSGINEYSLEKIVFDNSEIKIEVGGYSNLYIVAKSDGTKIGKFMFKASLYSNPLSAGAIVGIVLGSIAFCAIVITIIIWWVKSCKRRSQAKRAVLLNRQAPQINPMQSNMPRAQPSQYPQPNQYVQPGSQPSQYNQPPYQQYPTNQPISQPYAYVKQGYKEGEPLLQNAAFQVSNSQQPAYPYMPQTNKYLPPNPAYPTPGGKE